MAALQNYDQVEVGNDGPTHDERFISDGNFTTIKLW
jgi:hypothetical protein